IGFAAVQIALLRGKRVIATAGETYAQRLRDLGAQVTAYGDGVVERVREIAGGPVDLVLNTAPVGGSLPDLVQIAAGAHHLRFRRRRGTRRPRHVPRGPLQSRGGAAGVRAARRRRGVHGPGRGDVPPGRVEGRARDQPERARPGQAPPPARSARPRAAVAAPRGGEAGPRPAVALM